MESSRGLFALWTVGLLGSRISGEKRTEHGAEVVVARVEEENAAGPALGADGVDVMLVRGRSATALAAHAFADAVRGRELVLGDVGPGVLAVPAPFVDGEDAPAHVPSGEDGEARAVGGRAVGDDVSRPARPPRVGSRQGHHGKQGAPHSVKLGQTRRA